MGDSDSNGLDGRLTQEKVNTDKMMIIDGIGYCGFQEFFNMICPRSDIRMDELLSQEKVTRAWTEMVLASGIPFSSTDGKGLQNFFKMLCPNFDIPSRMDIAREVFQIFKDEKEKLKSFLIANSQRVCLSTQTWTDVFGNNHIALMVHFIDSGWKLHKKMLNFCPAPDLHGEEIGSIIASCLLDWGIERVLTITVDNEAADEAIDYVKTKLKGNLLEGEFLHMRCYGQIVNLIVTESLTDMHNSIASIRSAVGYIKTSSAGMLIFKKCAEQEKIDSTALVELDFPNMWNTTFLMLRDALKFQKAFEKLEVEDKDFGERMTVPPTIEDWENIRVLVELLNVFYNVTLKMSSSGVTSNTYFREMSYTQYMLKEFSQHEDSLMGKIATSMKRKYYKYWDSVDINKLLIISLVLDPRYKLDYVEFFLDEVHDVCEVEKMAKEVEVKELLLHLYEVYVVNPGNVKDDQLFLGKNEVDTYLLEAFQGPRNDEFDKLHWWKVNCSRYPVLSRMARDVFSIPVSTVTSTSAFRTEKSVLIKHQGCMRPRFQEAVMCTNDWLQPSHDSVDDKSLADNESSDEDMECDRVL